MHADLLGSVRGESLLGSVRGETSGTSSSGPSTSGRAARSAYDAMGDPGEGERWSERLRRAGLGSRP